ncbi:MAG: archease [Desulfobacteraceae bacterium]|nr:archease [Desulfobacteraceae bacterium]
MKYKLTDHTADFGIHVFGTDLQELFSNAAFAMFDIITDIGAIKGTDKEKIHVTGDDWPDLMVNWLREMLFLWAGRELLVKQVDIVSISEYQLTAAISADPYDPDCHPVNSEIKAVTYHRIQVDTTDEGWESKIIFDV